jgi:hopene-associated glycosyltransferase HpnB
MTREILLGLAILSLASWLILFWGRGRFWQADQKLDAAPLELESFPSVGIVIPARNEADLLVITLRSLLNQDYPGKINIVLVDDHSSDATAQIATAMAESSMAESDGSTGSRTPAHRLQVVLGQSLPSGWTGKLWAIDQGIRQFQRSGCVPDYFLLTDADIEHDRRNLLSLVTKAEQDRLNLVSLMVKLRCQSPWEKLLIPAFVFFFQKLYPFRWVNDPSRSTAAAAGGCILIRRSALEQIGGIPVIRQALIDDCALAQAVKAKADASGGKKIWLGLGETTCSLRPYPSLASIWEMVTRTAFTQLSYSPLLLLGTVVGMSLIYIMPCVGTIIGLLSQNWPVALMGAMSWLLMIGSYLPTLRLYGCAPSLALCLPMVALLYMLMTLDSARHHWQGRGGAWKGRSYSAKDDLTQQW